MVAITDLCDLTDPDQMKPAKGAIKTAIEFKELRGIEVLKLASGFATWKTDKISNANAPLYDALKSPPLKTSIKAYSIQPI